MAVKQKVVLIDTQAAQTSVKDLRNQLKALKDTMLSTEQGTEEYNQALQKAADITHTLKEQTAELNASAMDFGQITGNITKAIGGVIAGFQAAKATMNLFGVENEEVIKSLEKMQNLMALTQALPAIDEGIKAFGRLRDRIASATGATNKFGKALISTGLGALAVLLGSIITNWDEFTKAIGLSEEAMTKFGNVVNGVMGVLTSSVKGLVTAVGKILKGDFSGALLAVKDGFNVVQNYNDAVAAGIEKRNEEAAKKSAEKWAEYVAKRKQQLNDEAALEEAKHKDGWKYTEEGKKYYEDYFDNLLKLYKKDSHEYNQVLIQKLNYEKAFLKENEKQQQTEQVDKRIEYLKLWVEKEMYIYSDRLTQIQSMEDAELDILNESWEKQLISEETFQQLKTDIERKYADERNAIKQDEADKEKQIQSEKLNAYMSIANNFADMLGSLADSMDESNREQFEAAKAFNISAAVIGTIAGAIGAYTGAASNAGINAIPMVGPALAQALGITNAAAVAASGAAQIAKLSKQQFGSKSAGSAKVNASPSTSAITSINAPVQYTQDVQGAQIEGSIRDSRVYVTESDITNTQRKVDVVESEARY